MTQDIWIFAYGSLLWDPGFHPAEAVRARLDGYHRSFCMWSIHYRGTEAAPGLVLALDAADGAACEGLALRPSPEEAEVVAAAIRARELISDAYEERRVPVQLADGRQVEALAYVVRRGHRQHARLAPEAQAEVIARARGIRGPNLNYLVNTAAHLASLSIADPEIEELLHRALALAD